MEEKIGNYSTTTVKKSLANNDGNVYDFIFEVLPHEEECIDVTYDTDGAVIRPDIDNLVHKEAPF